MKNLPNPNNIPQRNLNPSKGFTLVELLITITIIIVLAALVLTVSRKMKTMAAKAVAVSALKQVAAINVAYSTENDGNINTMRWDSETKTEGPPGGNTYVINTFWGRLQPYLCSDVDTKAQPKLRAELKRSLDSMFSTNTDSGRLKDLNGITMPGTILQGARIYGDISGLAIPFAFNENLHEFNKVLKVSAFGNPASVLYAAYGNGFFNQSDGKSYAPMAKKGQEIKNNIYYLEDKSAIASFLDGHVESIRPPIPDRQLK